MRGHSGIFGISGFFTSTALVPPNNDAIAFCFSPCTRFPYRTRASTKETPSLFSAKNCARFIFPKLSKAPAMASDSKFFLLTVCKFTRSAKSKISLNSPFSSRSRMISSTAPFPTPLIAAIPKRRSPFLFTKNLARDSFTSGPRTGSPMWFDSSMKMEILSALERLRLNTAAINSAG